jgi:hypothetical protein
LADVKQPRVWIILFGIVVLAGIAFGYRSHRSARSRLEVTTAPAANAEAAAPKVRERHDKIYRMEGSLEQLRKFPAAVGMERADDTAFRVLPQGVEVPGEWVEREAVLESYAHPDGKRWFIIMKPGDRAYSVIAQ